MKNQILIFLLLCLAFAAAAQKMTLEECVVYAIDHNPNLKSVQLDEEINVARIKEVKGGALPQISANGRYSNNFALAEQLLPGEIVGGEPGTTVPVTFGVANMLTGQIEVNQVIFNKSLITGMKAAKASQDLIALNTFAVKEELIYNIAQAYLQLQINQEQTQLLTGNLDRVNKLIDISQIQFEEGIIKKIDVDQLRVNRTNLLSQIQNVEIGITQSKNLLKFYMGMPQNENIEVENFEQNTSRVELQPTLDLRANTNLRLLDQQYALKELDLEANHAGYYPTLSAFANYGFQGQTAKIFSSDPANDIQTSPTGLYGLQLSIPIFDGLQRHRRSDQIRIEQMQIRLNRQYATNSVEMEFANANENLRQNKTLIDAQRENMNLAEELYEVTRMSYREGVAPLTELLNAETSLQEAQAQYLTATLQLNIAELDHLRTSGQLAKLIRTESGE